MLGVSMGKAYKILREMNKDLASKGFSQLPGKFRWSIFVRNGRRSQGGERMSCSAKLPVEYFKEKWYGGAKEVSA